jgi:hypothetical protein
MSTLKFFGAFALGAVLLLALSFTIYRRSYYYQKAQAEAAGLEEKPGLRSRFVTLAIFVVMIAFFVLFDVWISAGAARSFVFLGAVNLLLAFLLSLFDALFIDYFLLLVWRPAVLGLPEGQPTRARMLRHIKIQLTMGSVFLLLIALPAAAVASLLARQT